MLRHIVALSVFVGACIGGAVVFDVSEDGLYGYTLLCGFIFLPLAAAVWAFLSSSFSPPVVWTSTPEELARVAAFREALASSARRAAPSPLCSASAQPCS